MHGFTREPNPAQVRSIAERLHALFAGNETGHHTFTGIQHENGLFKCVGFGFKDGPPTIEDWENQLLAVSGIGITAICKDGMVWFTCIDLDNKGANAFEFDPRTIVERIDNYKKKKLPLIPVNSKNYGLHLFVFFKDPVPAFLVRRVLRSWAKALRFPDNVEIFPKQDAVNDDGRGSNLWMPFFGYFSGNEDLPQQVMINAMCNYQRVEDFLCTADSKAITREELVALEIRGPGRPRKDAEKEEKDAGPRYGTMEWAEAKLTYACEEIRRALPGNLNNTVTQECFFPGRIVGGDLLDDEETWDLLSQAITANPHHDQKMIDRGQASYEAGKRQPLEYTAKRDGPTIRIEANQVADTVDQIEQALIQGNRNLYQRSGRIVYPCQIKGISHSGEETLTPGVDEIRQNRLFEFADSVATYEKFSSTKKGWILCDAPRSLVSVLLERGGDLKFPVLRATINTPMVFPDGRVFDTPGYDGASGLLYDPQGVEFPPILANPTKDEAIAALKVIHEPLAHYKFKDSGDDGKPESEWGKVSRAVAHSLMITGVVRSALDLAPGYAISASAKGSGKGKLVQLVSVLAVNDIPRTITQGGDGEEFEKRIVSELRVNTGMISISNCVHPIEGDFIEEFLTNKRVNPRILGLSENITVDNTNLMVWNGNNVQVVGDTVRRFVKLYIAPDVEFAYKKAFPFDPVEYGRQHRVDIVMAILTLLKAYTLATDKPVLDPLHSFDLWSSFVRGAVIWAGGADPVASQQNIVEEDEDRLEVARVMAGWAEALGDGGEFFTLEKVCSEAEDEYENRYGQSGDRRKHQLFYEALQWIEVYDSRGGFSPKKLGWWLRKRENMIVDGTKFVKLYDSHSKKFKWALKTG
jgi:hypothetical protein